MPGHAQYPHQLQSGHSCVSAPGLGAAWEQGLRLLRSVVLAQAKEQHPVGIEVMDSEVNQTRVRVPALPPADSAALDAFLESRLPERTL